ncbi:cupin domain-containing protein [Asticcacaulis sp. AND118]|uniref:cupin domain-containing protein n=1 Tax=Asticcacaulis sp. AND118 TaxID=2840468 RepID=UPI001CFFD5EE|nr:cupin domain-containing protein [Asticcacaulis sp. AND118]UDF02888.1 cupin domain-containing protein [Asticcacaulis sp. AND118]
MTDARALIAALDLKPHPEGGHYAETFRDNLTGGRGASSAIYYLLQADERSHWHRIDAVEVWHYYAGAPLRLSLHQEGRGWEVVLGPDVLDGQRPQAVVPVGGWQSVVSLGDWTLVGCTVAPGFDFAGFEMAPPGWAPE